MKYTRHQVVTKFREYDQLSSLDLCSNIKNGGGSGRGNGSCSGNLTTQFATEFESFVFLVTGWQLGSRADSRVKDNLVRKIK